MPSVAVQTSWSWLEDIAQIANYYQQTRAEDVTLHLSVSRELAEQLNKGVSSVGGRGLQICLMFSKRRETDIW